MKKRWTVDAETAACMLYLAAVVLYVLEEFFNTTLFHISWPSGYLIFVRILVCVVILLKAGGTKAYAGKKWLVCLLAFVAFKISWQSTGYDVLLDIALLTIGAAGVPYKKVLKAGFWTGLYVLLLAMVGSFTGCIKDLIYLDDGLFKHSFGIIYPTDYAAHVVFLFLAGWVLYGQVSNILSVVCAVMLSFLIYSYSGSRTSTIILALAAMGILHAGLTEQYGQRFFTLKRLSKYINNTLTYALPFCAVLMLALTSFYATGNEIASRLNNVLSNRMSLAQSALEKYGITLFGTPFAQRGFGGTTAWTWALEYSFVDSSYMLIMIRYGLVTLLVVCFLFVRTNREALRHGHCKIVLAAALFSVHSIMEHHLPEVAYNLFLLLPFTDFTCMMDAEAEAFHDRSRYYTVYITGAVIGIAMWALLPGFVTYMKTIVGILHLAEAQKHAIFIVVISACLMWTILLIRLVFKVILALVQKNPLPRTVPFWSVILLSIFCFALMKGEQVMHQGKDNYQMLLEADAPVVETLLEAENVSQVYVEHLPELYRRDFAGISNKILSGEGLARRKNTTLITEDKEELWILMAAGYEYGELSSGHAVYTNNEEAVNLLESIGIQMEPYYSRKTILDLQDVSIWNGLPLTEEGSLLLSGLEQSLLHGPWCTVYKGTLHVQYVVRLIGNAADVDTVATARLTSDGGLRTWKSQDIHMADFDENKECICLLERKIDYNCPNVEFILSVADGVELEILEISYGKVR